MSDVYFHAVANSIILSFLLPHNCRPAPTMSPRRRRWRRRWARRPRGSPRRCPGILSQVPVRLPQCAVLWRLPRHFLRPGNDPTIVNPLRSVDNRFPPHSFRILPLYGMKGCVRFFSAHIFRPFADCFQFRSQPVFDIFFSMVSKGLIVDKKTPASLISTMV